MHVGAAKRERDRTRRHRDRIKSKISWRDPAGSGTDSGRSDEKARKLRKVTPASGSRSPLEVARQKRLGEAGDANASCRTVWLPRPCGSFQLTAAMRHAPARQNEKRAARLRKSPFTYRGRTAAASLHDHQARRRCTTKPINSKPAISVAYSLGSGTANTAWLSLSNALTDDEKRKPSKYSPAFSAKIFT